MWTESKSNKETFVYISDQQTFVFVVQNALPIVIKRSMRFWKPNFKLMLYSVTCYIKCYFTVVNGIMTKIMLC